MQDFDEIAGYLDKYDEWAQLEPDKYFIQTYRGEKVDLFYPTPDDIDAEELALLASRIHRFGGHTETPYTIAEHMVVCSKLVPPSYRLAALLHDAHEAYLGSDILTPLKAAIDLKLIRAIEHQWNKAIAAKFQSPVELFYSDVVKEVDNLVTCTERNYLQVECAEMEDYWKNRIGDQTILTLAEWDSLHCTQIGYQPNVSFLSRLNELLK